MDVSQRTVLRTHHTAVVEDLEPRDVLPQLYQDGIITENDFELISEGKTRRQRCQLLLAMLPTRGPQAYGSFTHALSNDGYNHISEVLNDALGQLKSEDEGQDKQIQIKPFRCTKGRTNIQRNDKGTKKIVRRKKITLKISDSSEDEKEQLSTEKEIVCDKCYSELRMEEAVDPGLRSLLKEHYCLLMDNVEPRDITDYPYQERLLTEDECERIHGGTTRRDRCALLIQILSTKNPEQKTVKILREALKKKYSFIAEKFKELDTNKGEVKHPVAETKSENVVTIEIIPYKDVKATYANTLETSNAQSKIKKSSTVEADGSAIRMAPEAEKLGTSPLSDMQKMNGVNGFSNLSVADKEGTGFIIKSSPKTENRSTSEHENVKTGKEAVLFSSPASFSEPNKLPNRTLVVTFNHMSSLINQGEYEKFENLTFHLGRKFHSDTDMKCLLAYLQASRHLFGNNFDSAKEAIEGAMEIVPMTTNPKYFTVELYTAKTRMYITQKKLKKLEDALDDVKMVIESDPIGCSGRAAGWLYMNDGRNKTSQIGMLNFNKPSAISAYEHLFRQAKDSFTRALTNFEKDGCKDGPFGAGFAVCRLAILLLRCGDNGLTMDVMVPPAEDIQLAGGYIQRLEDSDIPINKILSLHYFLAKSDFQFRKSNMTRALEHAQAALDVSMEINLKEFIEHARNRVLRLSMLSKGAGVRLEEVTEELEFNRLIMTDSSE